MQSQLKVPKYRDSKNREWTIQLNIQALRDVRSHCGIKLEQAFYDDTFAELEDDPIRLCEIIWILVEDQAKDLGVTPEDFGRGFGETWDEALAALLQAIINFSPPVRRPALQKAVDKFQALRKTEAKAMEDMVDDPRLLKVVEQKLEEAKKRIDQELLTFGN